MPTPYINALHKQHKIPVKKLEHYWNRAKELAKSKDDSSDYALVTGIFKRIIKNVAQESKSADVCLSEDEEENPDEDAPMWWNNLSHKQQTDYLDEHPNSKFSTTAHKHSGNTSKGDWWDTLQHHEQSDYLESHKDSSRTVSAKPTDFSMGDVIRRSWAKKRHKTANVLRHHTTGVKALGKFLTGGKIGHDEADQAKKTAGLCAKLVLGAFVGVALMAGLMPLAVGVAQLFMSDNVDSSSMSSDMESLSAEDQALMIADKFAEWLSKQEPDALLKRIGEINV